MTLRIPNTGEADLLAAALGVGYTLKLYRNNATLTDATVAADLTEATFSGYSARPLTGGSWAITPGSPTVGVYAQQSFTSTADQAAQTIYGYMVVRTSDGRLQWVEAFGSPIVVQYNNDSIRVTPRITLADTLD